MADIKPQVRSYIADNFYFGKDGALADDDSLLSKGVLDSTGVLELAAFLEKTFAITVQDDELMPENLDSLNAIEAYVRGKLATPANRPE